MKSQAIGKPCGKIMLPAIIVMNMNYLPKDSIQGFKVGATSLSLKIAQYFNEIELLLGFLLYKRDESLVQPELFQETIFGFECVILAFNFKMEAVELKDAIKKAIFLMKRNKHQSVIAYYQTDTLLSYHPAEIPCCVTHHGPFVDDFQKHYSATEAYIAFESKEKAEHLRIQQEKGIKTLINKRFYVLQHSKLQGNYLLRKGVEAKRIKSIIPPLFSTAEFHQIKPMSLLNKKILDFITIRDKEIILFTAVARLDHFKNIEMFIKAALEVLARKIPAKILVFGDDEQNVRRKLLETLVPSKYQSYFLFSHKLPQDQLFTIYKELHGKSIFVFSSRYETLGITPLEAALSGVYTIVPNLPYVEASEYFPSVSKFDYQMKSLADRIVTLYLSDDWWKSNYQKPFFSKQFSKNLFKNRMTEVWTEISTECMSEDKFN